MWLLQQQEQTHTWSVPKATILSSPGPATDTESSAQHVTGELPLLMEGRWELSPEQPQPSVGSLLGLDVRNGNHNLGLRSHPVLIDEQRLANFPQRVRKRVFLTSWLLLSLLQFRSVRAPDQLQRGEGKCAGWLGA